MRKTRNTLLIALVFFGVSLAAVASAQTTEIKAKLGYAPADPSPSSTLQPGSSPSAGEPDVGQTGANRASLTFRGRTTGRAPAATTTRVVDSPLAVRIWWAWSMWMARYLNQTP